MLSVIIPAKNERYLEKTMRNILENATGEIEVIAVLDGYVPNPQIDIKDDRAIFLYFKESIGQRQAINEGVKKARGEYIMKLDAHCAVDKGFDTKLAKDCEPDWTVVPRMYNLNVLTWEPKLHKRTDYMYITSPTANKPFRAMYYGSKQPKNDKLIDDTMCCMGPGWFMHKKRFWELEGCDTGHGGWGQQGIEVALKAWLSGGSLKVNKNTWFAHWFRGGGVPVGHKSGFPYSISGRDVSKARTHSQDLWLNNKWKKQKRKLSWVIDKFNPPGWEEYTMKSYEKKYRNHFTKTHATPIWRGTEIVKYPNDLMLYQEAIYQNKPDFIIETGTYKGGSALFMADMCELMGHGHIITIDKYDFEPPKHERITHILARSTEKDTLEKVKKIVGDGSCMVILDSNHHRSHVKRELVKYGNFVTKGQYMVVEDTIQHHQDKVPGPKEAVKWFMKRTKRFKLVNPEKKYVFSLCPDGWLKRL